MHKGRLEAFRDKAVVLTCYRPRGKSAARSSGFPSSLLATGWMDENVHS